MAIPLIVTLSVLFVLTQGSDLQEEPETAVEGHQLGDVTSGAPIRFPETRPAPQAPSSAGGYRGGAGVNTGTAPRPRTVTRPVASPPRRPQWGPYSRPTAGGNAGRPSTGGAGFGNPYRIPKPYSIL